MSYNVPHNADPFPETLQGQASGGTGLGFTYAKVTDPAHGQLTFHADGTFTYSPTTGYFGPDSFTYQATDGAGTTSVAATVTLNVAIAPPTPTILPPTATLDPPTATAIPTDEPTIAPTGVSTITPTAEPTIISTATTEPTQSPATGQLSLTLSTSDGGDVPDDAVICIDAICQTLDDAITAAAASGTIVTFDLAPGSYDISVTGVAPYADVSGEFDITANETTNLVLQLDRAIAPTTPSTPGSASPVATVTTVPTAPAGASPIDSNAGARVTALPNTGAGQGSSSASLLALFGATILLGLATLWSWRRRRI